LDQASSAQHVGGIAAKPVCREDPELIEVVSDGIGHELPAAWAPIHRDRARHAVVDVASHDLGVWLRGQASLEGVDLGLDRATHGLVVGTHSCVCRHPPEPRDRFSNHQLALP
jgi:hypothetical protein